MKKQFHILLGIIQTVLSFIWLFQIVNLYYRYHFTDILFAFRLPDWVLFINILLCIVNIYFGVKLILNKVSFKKSFIVMGICIVLGYLVDVFYYLI